MILANYLVAAAMFCLGLYILMAHRNLIKIVMGLTLMESSTYVLIISVAHRRGATSPVLVDPPKGTTAQQLVTGNVADPVLQNAALTAVVVGVAVTAVLLAAAVRVAQHYRTLDANRVRQLRG